MYQVGSSTPVMQMDQASKITRNDIQMSGVAGLVSYNGVDSHTRPLVSSQITPSGYLICRSISVRDRALHSYVNASTSKDGDVRCHTIGCYSITINQVLNCNALQ